MRKLLSMFVLMFAFVGAVFAQVDANTADTKQLESIKGIGPKTAQDIVAERTKNGSFKNADDFKKRIKGVGDKKIAEFTKNGLVIGGAAPANTAPVKSVATPAEAKKPELKK